MDRQVKLNRPREKKRGTEKVRSPFTFLNRKVHTHTLLCSAIYCGSVTPFSVYKQDAVYSKLYQLLAKLRNVNNVVFGTYNI